MNQEPNNNGPCDPHAPSSALSTPPSPTLHSTFSTLHSIDPWPQPVDLRLLLASLRDLLRRFVVLPKWAAETLALWILHTYAFELRDVSTYIGIESPQRRCGKTTLLTILCQLVNRPV